MLLETYSSLDGENLLNCLPKFLNIVKETTGDPSFSMFNLSLKEDWSKTKKFCHSLHGKDQRANQALDQAYHVCNAGSANVIVQTNGMAQLNNHNNINNKKVHCESSLKKHNNHENHHVHSECHAADNNAAANAVPATTTTTATAMVPMMAPPQPPKTTNSITSNKSSN